MRGSGNAPRPNVVMILLDQFRNDARESHPIFETLLKKGVLFSQTITYAPYTLASCHATFTGMYGRSNGVDAYTKSDQYDEHTCFSIPQYLKEAGYYTRGYTFSPILIPHPGFDSLKIVPEDEETNILKNHLAELSQCYEQSRPFFSYLHYGEIHHQVLREVIQKYEIFDDQYFGHLEENKKRYQEYTRQAGEYVECLLEFIQQSDPEGNTLVILLTDHGAGNGEKPGEKAYGTFTYDYSIRIWQYWVWPKALPQNKEINWQVRTIDILPTLLDLLKITPKSNKKSLMGASLLPVMEGKEKDHRLAFSETGGVEGAYPSPDAPNIRCVRDGRWKLIHNVTTQYFELYDLEKDPEETQNLYAECPEQADRLWRKMLEYL